MKISAVVQIFRQPRRLWLGLMISVIFLYLALQQVDYSETAASLQRADWLLISVGVGSLVATFVGFAIRWRNLLRDAALLPVQDTFAYIMISYLVNTVLPLRVGDLTRAVLLGKRHSISTTLILGTVMLERVLDVFILLAMALALSLIIDMPLLVRAGIMTFAGGALIAFTSLFLLARIGSRFHNLIPMRPSFVHDAAVNRVSGLVTRFSDGLSTLRDGKQFILAIILSVLAWTIAGAGMVAYVKAFHLPAPWYAALLVLVVTNLGGAIPSSPGAVGVYHYLAVLALSVWVPDKSQALGFAIATHGMNILVNILIGFSCLAREGITLRSTVM